MQVGAADAIQDTVDFRYAPPEWQTVICLPDDPHKSIVDRSGELIYHYNQGGREFATRVGVAVTGGATWPKQELTGLAHFIRCKVSIHAPCVGRDQMDSRPLLGGKFQSTRPA